MSQDTLQPLPAFPRESKRSASGTLSKRRPYVDTVTGRNIVNVGHSTINSVVPLALLQSAVLLTAQPCQYTDSRDARSLYLQRPFGPADNLSPPHLNASTSSNHSRKVSESYTDPWPMPSPLGSPMTEQFKTLFYQPAQVYPPVRMLNALDKKRILVTGGAGFVGSHLVDRLLLMGHEVTVLDNFFSGSKSTLSHWVGHPNFEMVRHDITESFLIEVDQIYHLACPASPTAYQYNAIKTMKTNFMGTMNMLGLAKRVKARFLLASTSEVYGSPEEHPQREEYWGKVNPIGPRACYDEGKRVAEALTYGYMRQDGVDVRVARIFNTFGPRMSINDGRVVSNFVNAALKGEDLKIYGDGSQSRSLQYVHDLVDGLILLMNSDAKEAKEAPVNLGTDVEKTIAEWASIVIDIVDQVLEESSVDMNSRQRSRIIHADALPDDPPKRRADSSKAARVLGWRPRFSIEDGIRETAKYFMNI